MAILREFDSSHPDRSLEDRRRHRQLVEKSIKDNLSDIVSEESIIGQSKDKKVKIPIKGIKEYQFIYGDNGSGVGSGDGSQKRGDTVGKDSEKGQEKGGPGSDEGEDVYETEITLEDIINYLIEDLELPMMEKKRFSEIISNNTLKRAGYQRKGINPRFAKKKTAIEKIKRQKTAQKAMREANGSADTEKKIDIDLTMKQRFPYKQDDLRYFRVKHKPKRELNAAVICIMDTSGSMDSTKKYLARSFFFILYHFIRMKYNNVEVKFIAHSTTAKVVTEGEFFHKVESGGTYISSGLKKALDVIEENYNPAYWNVYTFCVTDGENWYEDNEDALKYALQLSQICNLFGYSEIIPGPYNSGIKEIFQKCIKNNSFTAVTILEKQDVWKSLKKILKKELEMR